MPKKSVVIALSILILVLLAIWSPWNKWQVNWTNFLGIDSKDAVASLKVLSFGGEIEVYMDEEFLGSAIEPDLPLEVNPIDPGEHLITLKRKGPTNAYTEITRKINFEPSIDVIIGFEIGPTEEFSEGHILYAKKSFIETQNTTIDIFSFTPGISVSLNDRFIGETPLKDIPIAIDAKQKLTFSKPGYDQLEIMILPDTQEERDKIKGLKLNLEVNLFVKPINVTSKS